MKECPETSSSEQMVKEDPTEASSEVSATLYVTIMLAIIAVCTLVSVPPLFFKKCPKCGTRNFVEARKCKVCETPLPDERP